MSVLAAVPAFAREELVPGSRYTSGRGAGMGDAVLPLGEDAASGLFYNPADLARIRVPDFELMNLGLYANTGLAGMLNLSFYQQPSLSGYLPTLQANPDTYAGSGLALLPNFSMKGFAFGVLMQTQLAAVYNSAGATVRYKSVYQFIPTLGTGIKLASGIVRLGYSLQWVNEAVGDQTVPLAQASGYNQSLSSGSGLSHNFGMALTLPYEYLPALNFVARNVLTTSYSSFSIVPLARNSAGVPASDPATYDSSLSLTTKLGSGSYFNWVAEYRDISNVSGVPFLGRMAFGAELSVKDQVFLRGGFGSGYPSGGIGFRRKGGEFSLNWYSEEVGAAYLTQRDTRYLLHYQIRAF